MKKALMVLSVLFAMSLAWSEPFELLGMKSGMTKAEVLKMWPLDGYEILQLREKDLISRKVFYTKVYVEFTSDGLLYRVECYVAKGDRVENLATIRLLNEKFPGTGLSDYSDRSSYTDFFVFSLTDDVIMTEAAIKLQARLQSTFAF